MAATSTAGQRDELHLVAAIIDSFAADISAVRVLDCGGGTGRLAVAVARLGAEVTVVDISVDALATLSRRAIEAGVADRVRSVQGDIEVLGDSVSAGEFDLVLVHGVLDAVDPGSTLAGVRAALRPGGVASVLVANPAADVLAKVLTGELESALDDLRAGLDLGADVITRLCAEVGLPVEQVRGVGVFAELIPLGSPNGVTASGRAVGDLADELEARSSGLSPFREIAARLHITARAATGA